MNVQERLGRRKDEARAGLEAARGRSATLEEFPVRLAALIAGLASGGADKLTVLPSDGLRHVGPLVQGLLDRPVVIAGEPLGKKSDYEIDRFFVSMALASEPHDVTSLAESGHPVVQWKLEPPEVDAEPARWERIKSLLDQLLPAPEIVEGAAMPAEPSLRAEGLLLFAPEAHAQVLRGASGTLGPKAAVSPAGWIAAQLALADPGDHVVLASWLPRETDLSPLQGAIRNVTRLACTRSIESARAHPRGWFFLLTNSDAPLPELPAGRALRVHAEDGDPAHVIQALQGAVKMLSRR